MFKGLITDATASRRHVTMAGAGEIGDLTSFTQHRLREQTAKLREKKVSSAAIVIQSSWKRFQAQRQLAFLLTIALFKYSHACAGTIQYNERFTWDFILLKSLPLSLQWRQRVQIDAHGEVADPSAGEILVYKPTQSELMELLLLSGKSFAKNKNLKYFIHDQTFLEWSKLVNHHLALPPVWECVAKVYLRLLGEASDDQTVDLSVIKTLLYICASISGWKGINFKSTCDHKDLKVTFAETRSLLAGIISHLFAIRPSKPSKPSSLSLATLLELAAQNQSILIELIISQLMTDENAAKWEKLREAVHDVPSQTLQVKLMFSLLLNLAREANHEKAKEWNILLRSTRGLMNFVESFNQPLISPLSQKENSEVAEFAFKYACDVSKHLAKIPKHLVAMTSHQFPNLLPLLMLAISNVKLEANDSLRVVMREPSLLRLLFSFEDRDEMGMLSRLKIVFPPTSLGRFLTQKQNAPNIDISSGVSYPKLSVADGGVSCMKLVVQNFVNGSLNEPEGYDNDTDDETGSGSVNVSRRTKEYFGFVEPLDLTVFDNLILSTQLPRLLLRRIGTNLFDSCGGSVVKFVESLGPPPSFNSDNGLICKCFIDLILRMFLLADDSRFGDCTKMQQEGTQICLDEAKSVWTGIHHSIFPLGPDQMFILVMFIKHLAFSLINVLEGWAHTHNFQIARRSLAKMTLSEMSTLTRDTSSLSALLFKRGRRLKWRAEYGEIRVATQLLRAKTITLDRHFNDEIFSDTSPPPRGCVPELIVKILSLIPHSVPFEDRVMVFNEILKEDRMKRGRLDVFTPFNAQTVTLRRTHLVDDAINIFCNESIDLKAALKVRFIDAYGSFEQGIDGGGLFREFLTIVSKELFSPEKGLFRLAGDETLIPNNAAYELFELEDVQAEDCYKLAGIIVGKALFETLPLGAAELNPLFLNRVMGGTNTFDDLQYADIELYKNIKFVRDYLGNVADLGLTFSATTDVVVTKQAEYPLVVNGGSLKVNNENKIQYCLLLSHFLANKVMDRAAQAFLCGLKRSIDISWLHLFDALDIQYLISGRKQIGFDVEDLRRNTVYATPYCDEHPLIEAFWAFLRDSPQEFQAKFLHFVTSSDRMPLLGFASLNPPFSVVASGLKHELPSASTCINVLRVPEYPDASILRTKLTQAVEGTEGFYLA